MRSLRYLFCGLALFALTAAAGAENWVVQIPIQAPDGREVMLPLALAARAGADKRNLTVVRQIAQSYTRDPLPGSAWSLFPQTDASQRIVFMKRGAQYWTVQRDDDDSVY
jgi:hypothetical protein